MWEIIGPVMQLGEWLWTPVKRGMSYMVHYKRNLQSLGDPVQKLETMLNSHKQSVDIAQMSGDGIKPEVRIWLRNADKAMTDVEELNGAAGAGEKCSIGWCPDLKWRHNLGKNASNLTTTLKDEVTIIGVHGMGGIGKTTLVKQVGALVCKDGLFDLMIMAVFSQNPVVVQIQDQLALQFHETTEMARAATPRERIIRAKKMLIILDDIWETINLSIIGIPSLDELEKCGSKVILTTRRLPVCCAMRSDVMIPLNRLSEDDSWNFFVKNANRSFESINFNEVAKQV